MQRMPSREDSARPKPQQASRSFTRYEPLAPQDQTRSRSCSLQNEPVLPSDVLAPRSNPEQSQSDIFEARDSLDNDCADLDEDGNAEIARHEVFEELPIEIRNLVER